ncbi:olfactory receptor 6N1-like [Megalops cyprinoides]|uniref:olfactory receptor 6N1-like n=1 Tax=Megalops cyprinoides TaxID=118141 RepID=UPI00186472A1|nr:olfactory receptor 6N1-like [Megalops cyprinoides]
MQQAHGLTFWKAAVTNETQYVQVSEFIITGFSHLSNQMFLGFIILLTYFLILLGSGTNICIIASDRRLHTPMYILICNLAVVDIMFTTSASTTMISVLLTEVKTISYYSCISRMYVYHVGDINGCFALLLMAIDRMVAISNPLRYHSILTNTRTFVLIFLCWLLATATMGVLAGVVDRLPFCQPFLRYVFCDYPCMVRAACVDPERYFLMPTVIGIALYAMFPCILLTYAKIIYTVLRLSNVSNKKQMFSTCTSHIIVVASYYVPKFITTLLTRIGLVLDLSQRNALLIAATLIPSLINPMVYCLRTKEIKNRLVSIVKTVSVTPLKLK